jgi:hypothetical protein
MFEPSDTITCIKVERTKVVTVKVGREIVRFWSFLGSGNRFLLVDGMGKARGEK